MAFLFYIDGQLTDQPVNDTALVTSIKRDNQLGALLITQDVELIYNGNNNLASGEVSGYTVLKDIFIAGSCDELDITIYDQVSDSQTEMIYKGVIKVPQITIDEQNVTASTKVQDDSYYSYINNNKNIEFNIQSTKTKNREDILPCQIYDVDLFDSFTGIYGSFAGLYFRGYRVYDVFKYLISALSDNKVGFESFYLQTSTNLFLFDGFAIGHANTDPAVKVSFEKLYNEIKRDRNVSFYIDATDPDNPVLRLEDFASLYSGVQLLEFEDIKELIARIRTDRIYGTIRVGADYNPGGSNPLIYTFNAGTSYLGWMEEVYAPLGQCNVDNEFNLVSEFIIASNAIQDQLVGGATGNDDKLFLIECDNVDTVNFTAIAIDYDAWASTDPFKYYNEGLNNPSKLIAHASNFQTGLTNTLEIGGNGFKASLGQELTIGTYDPSLPQYAGGAGYAITPVVFPDETTGSNYDGGNNYDITTGIFVAPIDGNYTFNTRMFLDVINILTCPEIGTSVGVTYVNAPPNQNLGAHYTTIIRGFTMLIGIAVYTDNTLTTLVSQNFNTMRLMLTQYSLPVGQNKVVQLTTGQAVVVNVFITASEFAPELFGNTSIAEINQLPDWSVVSFGCLLGNNPKPAVYAAETSNFSCTASPDGGGIVIDNDPALYKSKEYSFSYSISQSDWLTIKANPIGKFTFEKDGELRTGWIQEMTRNDWTGQTTIKLIAEDATTTQ